MYPGILLGHSLLRFRRECINFIIQFVFFTRFPNHRFLNFDICLKTDSILSKLLAFLHSMRTLRTPHCIFCIFVQVESYYYNQITQRMRYTSYSRVLQMFSPCPLSIDFNSAEDDAVSFNFFCPFLSVYTKKDFHKAANNISVKFIIKNSSKWFFTF